MKRLLTTTALFSFALLGPAPAFAACVLGGNTYTCTGTEAGTITLAADSEFDTSGGDANITGEITGPYGIAKIGANTLTLGFTNNSYSGITRIDAGTLSINNTNKLGDGSATNDIEFNGGTLLLTNSISTSRDIIMTGDGTISSSNNPITLSGVISGSGKFTKLGNGAVMTLTGNNTLSGIMELGQGAIAYVTSSNNLGDGSATNDIILDGGVIRYGASFDTNRDIAIGNGGTIDTNGFDTELSGVISGSQILLKQGAGTLTLSGNNTYSSLTQISQGTVAVSSSNNLGDGTSNNNIRLGGNATLKYDAAFNMGRIIILNGAPTDHANVDTNGFDVTWSGDVQGGGYLTKVGAGKLTLTGDNSNNSGALAIQGGTLSVSSTQRLGNISRLELDGGGLEITGALTTNKNMDFIQDGNIDIGANNVTLSGTLSGAGDLVKSGSGTLTVSGTNTYTGDTTINAGKLIATNASAIHGDVSNSGTLEFNNSANGTFAGHISGTGDFIKEGTGNLTLSATSSYSGKTYINDGTLTVGDGTFLGDGSAGNDIEFDGGTLLINNGITTNRDIILTGDGTIDGQSGTLSGVISGTGSFTKLGGGSTLTLSGTNTYSGVTRVGQVASIAISASNNLGDGSVTNTIELDGGALKYLSSFNISRDIAISSNHGVINTNGFDTTLSGVISGAGGLLKEGAGTLTLTNTNTFSDLVQVGGGTLAVSASDQMGVGNFMRLNNATLKYLAAFDMSRNIDMNGGSSANAVFDTNGFDVELSGNLGSDATLVKTGAGTLTLSSTSNGYTGTTSLQDGILSISAATNLGNTNHLEFDGGALEITGALTTNKNMTFTQDGEIDIGANNVTLSGTLSGAGDLVKSGSGTLTVSGTNTYTGDTTISAGRLIVNNTAGIHGAVDNSGILEFNIAADGTYAGGITGTGSFVKDGAGLLTLTGTNAFTGGTTIEDGAIIGTTSSLTGDFDLSGGDLVFNQSINGTYSGLLTGGDNIVKEGSGRVSLTGSNATFGGFANVNNGILAVNSDFSGTWANVAAAGILGGSGTLGRAQIDGKLAPGNSIGTITVNGDVDFNNGSVYEVEISPTLSDKLISTGIVTIHNGASVNILAGAGTYTNGFVYNIITSGTLTGTFDTLTEDLAFFDASLQYTGTDVNLLISRNNVDFSEVGTNPTQVQVGAAVSELGGGNKLYDAFSNLSTTQAQDALDTLSGEHNATIANGVTRSAGVIQSALTSHMTGLNHGGSVGNTAALAPISDDPSEYIAAYLEPSAGWNDSSLWFEAIGTMGRSGSQGFTPSQDRHSYGALGGIDIAMETGGYYGFFGGYETGEIETDAQRASSNLNNYHLGVYATKPVTDLWTISGGLGTTYHDIDTMRYVVMPGFQDAVSGNTAGQTFSAFAEIARTMEFEDAAIEPFANVSVTYSHIDGYTENDINGSGLVVDSSQNTTPTTVLGIRGGKQFVMGDAEINLNASLGWQHVYGDTDSNTTMRFAAGTSTFDSYAPARDRDAALIGAGIDTKIGQNTRAYAAYNGSLSAHDQDHGFKLGVKINF